MDGHGRCAAHDIDLAKAKEDPDHKPFDFTFLFDDIMDPDSFFLKQFISINFDKENNECRTYRSVQLLFIRIHIRNITINSLKDGYVAKAAAYYTFGKEPTREGGEED